MEGERNLLILIKADGERFIFVYDDDSVETMISDFWIQAEDPELRFNLNDAAAMAQRVREQVEPD